ncbi:hypothetical protein M0R19_03825 [Candidatus Pacearchaeota archaeon]|nr:hypothetical protein [Candidatus Pacearchaeota archaeon]
MKKINNKLEYYNHLGFFIDITDQYKNLPIEELNKICKKQYLHDIMIRTYDSKYTFSFCHCIACCLVSKKYKLGYSFTLKDFICLTLEESLNTNIKKGNKNEF